MCIRDSILTLTKFNDAAMGSFNVINLQGDLSASTLLGALSVEAASSSGFATSITGGSGNDILKGGSGEDTLIGGAGDDVLTGGVGNDILTLGNGDDDVVLEIGGGTDVITDFQLSSGAAVGNDDDLDISALSLEGTDAIKELGGIADINYDVSGGNEKVIILTDDDISAGASAAALKSALDAQGNIDSVNIGSRLLILDDGNDANVFLISNTDAEDDNDVEVTHIAVFDNISDIAGGSILAADFIF